MPAAVQLLDREGLAALSMRRLADELGTRAASLYWHVGSKDGLLDLVLDYIIGEGEVPDPDPQRWQEDNPSSGGTALPGDPESLQRAATMARGYVASLPANLFPIMTTLADQFAFADPDERFELLIDIFVDGLARRVAQP